MSGGSPLLTVPRVQLQELSINAIRVLSMDAVQKADSGHPGTPMALAPLAYVLWTRHLRYDPSAPQWPDRDRFVLSAGHASMLIYSVLYLTGYDLTLDDIMQFRQWESRTPGHPEFGYTEGVETTTGPLGQGFANAVGMAIAEANLAANFNRDGHPIVDHHTFFIASDGDVMEGISHEAASYAGHLGLGKLIGFYDDNRITIEGETTLTFGDDTATRFTSYGWHVTRVDDANDLAAIDHAISEAKTVTDRPSLIVVRSHIGYPAPNRQDTAEAHGAPLGEDEIRKTKEILKYPTQEPFHVAPEALEHWRTAARERAQAHSDWRERWERYARDHAAAAAELDRRWRRELPVDWDGEIPAFTPENGKVATRAASGVVLNAIAKRVPELVGGSADLASSTNTIIKGAASVLRDSIGGRNFHFGVREHGMGGILNGIALHGGFIPYGATFLIFSDYMRPAIRLAAIMRQHVIYVFTHDSIGLGEDGPTHQPIEQLSTLRAIPNLVVIRPADASEVAEAWRAALRWNRGPVALALTRQKLGFIDRGRYAAPEGLHRGAYVLAGGDSEPSVVLLGSGSEVALVLEAYEKLRSEGIATRAVSMPSHELFAGQDDAYRSSVLPPGVPRVAIEAAHPMAWRRWVGARGAILGIERFGASAPYARIYEELGLTVDRLVDMARTLARRS